MVAQHFKETVYVLHEIRNLALNVCKSALYLVYAITPVLEVTLEPSLLNLKPQATAGNGSGRPESTTVKMKKVKSHLSKTPSAPNTTLPIYSTLSTYQPAIIPNRKLSPQSTSIHYNQVVAIPPRSPQTCRSRHEAQGKANTAHLLPPKNHCNLSSAAAFITGTRALPFTVQDLDRKTGVYWVISGGVTVRIASRADVAA